MGRARVAALLLLAAAPAQAAADAEWIALFNGRDLAGWVPKIRGFPTGENFAATFRVENGLLTVSYDGYENFDDRFGHLFYETPYSHYRLKIQYRFLDEPAPGAPAWAHKNSGVMLHAQPPATMQPAQDFPISLEMQFLGGLVDGEARPTGNLCTPGTHVDYRGRFEDTHCIPGSGPTVPGKRWVMAEALVLGDERIVHCIDGKAVIEYARPVTGGGVVSGHLPELKPEGKALASGYIALQSEGHPLQFRLVELMEIDPGAGAHDPQRRRETGEVSDCAWVVSGR